MFIEYCRIRDAQGKLNSLRLSVFSHFIVVVVGFVDTVVEVNEADGQAILNASIISPLPMLGRAELQIMFALRVDSMDGSAGRDNILQCRDHA